MQPLGVELAGPDQQILLLRMPSHFADEWIPMIEQEVAAKLPRVTGAGLILDFEAVLLMNSLAITCILHLQDTCKTQKAPMFLAALPPGIERFLAQLKLDRRFKIKATVDEAVKEIVPGLA